MTLRQLLVHTAVVVSRGELLEENDEYNRPVYGEPVQKKIKCRLDQIKTKKSRDEYSDDVTTAYFLYASPNEEFDMNMTIKDVRDSEGNLVTGGEFSISSILPAYARKALHHYELSLSRGDVNYG